MVEYWQIGCAIKRPEHLPEDTGSFRRKMNTSGNISEHEWTISESLNLEWTLSLTITIEESSPTIFQEFTIEADTKTLRKLEDIAAYNVARSLLDNNDLDNLQLPRSLNTLVASFLDTYWSHLWHYLLWMKWLIL